MNFIQGDRVTFSGFGLNKIPGVIKLETNTDELVFIADKYYHKSIFLMTACEPESGLYLDNPGTKIEYANI